MGSSIVKNTLFLYTRTIMTILLNLYSTRIVMEALGTSDFGLYYVIGGIISMLSVLNNAMAVSTQRNISVALGGNDITRVQKIVSNSISLHLLIGLILIILFEIAGVYYLNNKLVFDQSKIITANWIFQFVVASSFISIISVPYDAILNSTEQMKSIAVVGVVEAICKVGIAFLVTAINGDRLLIFGLLTFLLAISIRIIKRKLVYSKSGHFILPKWSWDKEYIKTLGSFAGWNLLGSFSYMARTQGLSIVLNLFFGTLINAAFGLAMQISLQVTYFCSALFQAVMPKIMKSEGENNRNKMLDLAFTTSKFSFIIVAVLALPLMLEMSSILHLWLGNVPPYSEFIASIFLLSVLLNQITVGLDAAIHATGEIKLYMLAVGVTKILVIPFAFVVLNQGWSLNYVFYLYAFFEGVGSLIRIYVIKKNCGLNLSKYISGNFINVPISTLIIYLILLVFVKNFNFEYRWVLTILFSIALFLPVSLFVMLSNSERTMLFKRVSSLSSGILKKKFA